MSLHDENKLTKVKNSLESRVVTLPDGTSLIPTFLDCFHTPWQSYLILNDEDTFDTKKTSSLRHLIASPTNCSESP